MFIQSVRKIGKLLCSFALAAGLSACSSASDDGEFYKILCPTGAPALATLGAEDVENTTIDYVDGTDILMSELAKEDGDYDMIIAPINLGAKMYAQNQAYQLEAVLTWGNLYVVGEKDKEWEDPEAIMAVFGENAVPGLVFDEVLRAEVQSEIIVCNSVSEAQQAVLSGKADFALLAQPAAAATIAKGKEVGKDYKIIGNLQSMWQEKMKNRQTGYPQAGLFVKKNSTKNLDAIETGIQAFDENADVASIEKAIDQVGAETLGVPSAQIATNTWEAQNIRYMRAADCKDYIEQFLSLFSIALPETLIRG